MKAKELVRDARLGEALSALQDEIRANPGDASLRVFLFQLCCVNGSLERALNQLQVAAGLDPAMEMLARIFRPIIECELLRRRVFAGSVTPLIFGEPEEWMGLLVQALGLYARGDLAGAAELRRKALEQAPPNPGQVNGSRVAWLADADSRLGPVVEGIIQGKYYWIPFRRIQKLKVEKPVDLRDLVWIPTTFRWTNGGEVAGHIPVRYPGSETGSDGATLLGRRTDFAQPIPGTYIGSGQRLWASDVDDHPLLESFEIEFDG